MAGDHVDAALALLGPEATHADAERCLRWAEWTPCGAGDWAIALAAPQGGVVARISPFDPVGPFTARLYAEASGTGLVPRLFAHRRLAGGGDLQFLERLDAVPQEDAVAFLAALAGPEPGFEELAAVVTDVHAAALCELPWCGPLDSNPANVMRTSDGRLVLIDPYYADGPALYATARGNPDLVVARIPADERRYLTEIPLAGSGPWGPGEQDSLRALLQDADRRRLARSETRATAGARPRRTSP
ncbi:MAG: hypothetical protein L0G22_01725 [Propionibacteriaceae bacterium]|nr:hypothetical protein [Propionibacteriaceae bacterium]